MRFLQRSYAARLADLALGAEEFHLHAFWRDVGGIDDDERAVRTRRAGVNHPCRQLLAGAGRAGDHDAAIGRRHAGHGLAQAVRCGGRAHELHRLDRTALKIGHLALQASCLQGALGHENDPVSAERLLDEVVSAALDGGDRRLDVAVARYHHDRQVAMLRLDSIEDLQAVQTASLQPYVEEDEGWLALRHLVERLDAVARRSGREALVLENGAHELANVGLVVNDQDIGRHTLFTPLPGFACSGLRPRRTARARSAAGRRDERARRHPRAWNRQARYGRRARP